MNDKWISIDISAWMKPLSILILSRLLFAAGSEMVKKVCLLKKSENSGSLKFPNSMNGLRAVKALTDSRRKTKKIIRQGADKDGC